MMKLVKLQTIKKLKLLSYYSIYYNMVLLIILRRLLGRIEQTNKDTIV